MLPMPHGKGSQARIVVDGVEPGEHLQQIVKRASFTSLLLLGIKRLCGLVLGHSRRAIPLRIEHAPQGFNLGQNG
jgi:hypothetical protein